MQKYYVRVRENGNTYWYSDPEYKILHRLDGPAVETPDGFKAYYQNGKPHRLDGPAIIDPNKVEDYWIDGVYYTKKEFKKKTRPVKELTVAEVEKLLGYPVKIVND